MNSINIKGKEYVQVNERITYFRLNYKDHKIVTEIISIENGVCIMKAIILNPSNEIISMGHAYEKEGSTFINKTSYIENCETSAIGRALGILGIGIDTSIASAEEVETAIANQNKSVPAKTTPHATFETYDTITEEQKKGLGDMKKHYTENNNQLGLSFLKTIKTSESAKKAIESFCIKKAQKVFSDEYSNDETISGQQAQQ